jgi:AraC family transcriptional regulator
MQMTMRREHVLEDSRAASPASALLFSSAASPWDGGLLCRFRLQAMREEAYCYAGHLLALPRSGSGELAWRFEGQQGRAPVIPGAVSIQPAGRFLHRCEMRAVVCDTLNVDRAWLANLLAEEVPAAHADLRPLPCGEDRLLRHWMDALVACIPRHGERGAPLVADELMVRVGVHLLRNHGTHRVRIKNYQRGLEPWRLRRVLDFIAAHVAQPIALAALAEAAGGMSVFYFSRLFRQSTGMTPHRYVQHARLNRARALLEKGTRDLLEVALATGFCDHSHLTRSFKRQFGLTPSEFQRRGKSKNVQTRRLALNLG